MRQIGQGGIPMRRFMDFEEGDTFVVNGEELVKLGGRACRTNASDYRAAPELAQTQWCYEF
jgi:hypothetical protein